MGSQPVIFYSMAENEAGLRQLALFIQSLRMFGGAFADARVRIFHHPDLDPDENLPADVSVCPIPEVAESCRTYFFANKVYCAAQAEEEAEQAGANFIWIDDDTLILNEPGCLALGKGKVAALCPVMHNRTGVAWGNSPGDLWDYLDSVFNIEEACLFPLTAPADGIQIRPYFNAGLMVVDPGCRLMRIWKDRFIPLCSDPRVVDLVTKKPDDRIFLHQMVLTEILLTVAGRDSLTVLPEVYNYPLFFEELFPAIREFNDLSEAVTARYDVYFRNPKPGWPERLQGPPDKIDWLIGRLSVLRG